MKRSLLSNNTLSFSGQTMVEALVALAAAVIIISSITVAVVTSSSNTSYSTNQNKATQLARQGMEAARKLRDIDAAEFSQMSGVYCLGQDQTQFDKQTGLQCSNEAKIENTYFRTVTFQNGGSGSDCGSVTEVVAIVRWADGKCPAKDQFCRKVELVSCLSGSSIQ